MNPDPVICYILSLNKTKWNPTWLLLYNLVENLSFYFVRDLCVQVSISEFLAKKVISISLLDTVTSNTAKILIGQSGENYVVSAKWDAALVQ